MNLPDFLTRRPDDEIVLTGSRLTLYHFIEDHLDGKDLAEWYPDLSAEQIEQVLAFYRSNKPEVDDFRARYAEELREHRAALGPSCVREKLMQYAREKGWI